MKWEVFVDGAQSCQQVILVCSNGTFCSIASMHRGLCLLVIDAQAKEVGLNCLAGFIIHVMKLRVYTLFG